jgi:hypothetical protein
MVSGAFVPAAWELAAFGPGALLALRARRRRNSQRTAVIIGLLHCELASTNMVAIARRLRAFWVIKPI